MFYSTKLKKFKQIKHCFFSKRGGYSSGVYKSLNCGRGSRDKTKNVEKNLLLVKGCVPGHKNSYLIIQK